jgi:hypothetical protein
METLTNEDQNLKIKNYVFKKNQYFKYVGATITENNGWNSEICNRINKGERVYFIKYTLIKYFKLKIFSKKTQKYLSIRR